MKNRHHPIAFVLLIVVVLYGCQKPDPSVELKPVMDQYLKLWNTGDFENIEDVLHEEFVLRASPMYEAVEGVDGFKSFVQMFRLEFPDFTVDIDEAMYDEGRVAAIWTFSATNTGEGRFPTTGNLVSIQGISFHHIKDGKLLDVWIAKNDGYFMEQLGYQLMPPSSPPAEEEEQQQE